MNRWRAATTGNRILYPQSPAESPARDSQLDSMTSEGRGPDGRPRPAGAESAQPRPQKQGGEKPAALPAPAAGNPGEPDGDSAPARTRSSAHDSGPGGCARRGGSARGGAGRSLSRPEGARGHRDPRGQHAQLPPGASDPERRRGGAGAGAGAGLKAVGPDRSVAPGGGFPGTQRHEDRAGSSSPADLTACPSRHRGGAERRGARLAPGGHCPPPAQRAAWGDAGRVALRAPGMWPGGGGDGETLSQETSFSDEARGLKGVGLQT